MHRTGVLVISDGGFGALVGAALACAQAGHGQTHVWLVPQSDERRLAAVRSSASALGCQVIDRTPLAMAPASTATAGSVVSVLLLSAAHLAAELGLGRVLWPVHFGDISASSAALDEAAVAVERAMLISQLAMIDRARSVGAESGGGGGARIETPLVDLDDEQLLELALDLNAPLRCTPPSAASADALGAEGSGRAVLDGTAGASGPSNGGGGICWWECHMPAPARSACGRCAACIRWSAAAQRVDPRGRLAGLLVPRKPAA